jgi:hypothetical protein
MCLLHGVKAFENKEFRAIFVSRTEEEMGGWRSYILRNFIIASQIL